MLICVGFGAFHALVTLPLIHLLGHALGVPPAALSVPDLRLGQMMLDDAQNTQLAVIAYWILQFRYRGREERAQAGLGSYQLGELLGRGGMGEVYKATHRMLGRPVAIKLIRPEMIGARDGAEAQLAIRRFRREAEVAASLRSPHTVELHDFGVTTDQAFYFVMELLDGMDLESLVRQTGPVPAARAIHILRQVCESLEEAHARGLVHRDIKPANIHVGRLGLRHDFVKVLDFGLVKSVEGGTRGLASDGRRGHARDPGLYGAGDGARVRPSMAGRISTRWAVSPTTCLPVSGSSRRTPHSR